jgi:uncharacterized protein involved in outer membrane biogenesis
MKILKRLSITIGVLFALYAIAGFIFLPKVALQQIDKYTKENFNQDIIIQNITFNPLSLNLALHNVQIKDKTTKKNLISADTIGVDIDLFSLATNNINIDTIELIHPKIDAILQKDGKLNLAKIQPKPTNEKKDTTDDKPIKLPYFSIDTFLLQNATIDFTDNTLKDQFKTQISNFNYTFRDLSTKPKTLASHELSLNIDKQTSLKIDGGLYIDPMLIYGNIDLVDFQTNTIWPYLKEKFNFHLPNTLLDTKLGFIVDLKDMKNPQVTLKDTYVRFDDLKIQTKNTKKTQLNLKVFKLNEMSFNLQDQKVYIDSIALDRFWANAVINKDKTINLANLFKTKNSPKEQKSEDTKDKAKTTKPWDLLIDAIILKNSNVDFTDNSLAQPFKTKIANINFSIEELTLKPNDKFKYDLRFNLLDKATFSNIGNLSISPFSIESKYELTNIIIPKLKPYIQPNINFNINSATLSTKGDFTLTKDINILIQKASLSLQDLKLSPKKSKKNLITLKSANTSNINFDLKKQNISIDDITLNKLFSDVKIQKNKIANLQEMFVAKSKKSTKKEKKTKTKPWNLKIKKTNLKNSTILFADYSIKKPFKTKISQFNTTIKNISLAKNNKSFFNTSLRINKRGKLSLNGTIVLDPFMIKSKYKISSLSLPFIQPYLDETLNIDLKKAIVYTNGSFTFKQKNSYFALYSNVSLNNLVVDHKLTNKNLIDVKKIKINAINLKPNSLKVKSVQITEPQVIANIFKDGTTNFSQIVKETKNKTEDKKQKTKNKKPFNYEIGSVKMQNGRMQFSDATLPFEFKTDIQNLQGEVSTISSDISKPTKVALKGEVDKYGLADINVSLNTSDFKRDTHANIYFKNLEMKNYTPYSAKFVGKRLVQGTLSLDLNYNITDSKLEASNSIILEKLKFGPKVQSKDAVDLPLDLAIALLEDSNGVIDIDLPITGDINNPDFKFAPIVWGAFGKLIISIVTSPFKLLGSLLGVSSDELSQVIFKAGDNTITPPAKQSLDKVLKALKKRPNLALVLQPSYTKELDKYALQTKKLDKYLLEELEEDVNDKDDIQDELEDLYDDLISKKQRKEIEKSFYKIVKDKESKKEKEIFDQNGYIAKLKDAIIRKQTLEPNALEQLANSRTQAIKEYLITIKHLDENKISTKKDIKVDEPKDKKWAYYKLDINIEKK